MPDDLFRVRGLSKRFGSNLVVDDLSFEIRAGECLGVIGPNGAGKTTTLRMCLGLVAPDAGRIEAFGLPIPERVREAKARIGVVTQFDSLDPDFSCAENLRVFGRYFGLPAHTIAPRIPLLLDEPTTGLDPQALPHQVARLKLLLQQGKSILLTTHFMDEAERLCDRLIVLDHGRKIAEGTPRALIGEHLERDVVEVYGEGAAQLAQAHAGLAQRVETSGDTVFFYLDHARPLLDRLDAHPGLRSLHRPANLEDLFLKLTGRQIRDEA